MRTDDEWPEPKPDPPNEPVEPWANGGEDDE